MKQLNGANLNKEMVQSMIYILLNYNTIQYHLYNYNLNPLPRINKILISFKQQLIQEKLNPCPL